MKRYWLNLLVLAVFCFSKSLWAEATYSWDFTDCEIRDIVFAVAMDTGICIVCDDTVEGSGDIRFAGSDAESALSAFLTRNRLYLRKDEKVWTVSRFSMSGKNGLYTVDAFDMLPAKIVEKVGMELETALTYEWLPQQKVSVHLKDLTEAELIEGLARAFGGVDFVVRQKGFHFVKKAEQRKIESLEGFAKLELNEDNSIAVDVRDCRFSLVMDELFKCGKESFCVNYCLLTDADAKITRACFKADSFEQALKLLCGQNGFSYLIKDEVIYIYSDGNSRKELLLGERKWRRFCLNYEQPEKIFSLVHAVAGDVELMAGSSGNEFLAFACDEEAEKIETVVSFFDVRKSVYLISLKNITAEQFLELLPSGADRTRFSVAGGNSSLYFTGTEAAYNKLCGELALWDRPVKRLRYDLLIIEYSEATQGAWTPSLSAGLLKSGERNDFSVGLGSVLNLNVNVVTAFGLTFAAGLQASLEKSQSKIFADTTLHGVSGKEINFENTNVYRYRDNNLDPDTGKPVYSGVTREIVSGITININGCITGENMITTKVTARVSRQGTDTSSVTGNPPPTTEKVITTEVSGRSGMPVVLSGLIEDSRSEDSSGIPVLSKIPLLRWLFKSRSINRERSELVIYLVPQTEGAEPEKPDYFSSEKLMERAQRLLEL